VRDALNSMSSKDRRRDEPARGFAHRMVRRLIKAEFGKRPVTDVHVVRV